MPGTITVVDGPVSTRIHVTYKQNSSLLSNNDTLNCTADGYPEPTYRWEVNGTKLHDGGLFVVDICKLITDPVQLSGNNETTRSVKVDCVVFNDRRSEVESVIVNVSVVDYRVCVEGKYSTFLDFI